MNKNGRLSKLSLAVGAGLVTMAMMLLTRSVGRGQCPECGYRGDLHQCKHCRWVACLGCWQKMSQYNTCPKCGQSNP